jgi:hypothetical protein
VNKSQSTLWRISVLTKKEETVMKVLTLSNQIHTATTLHGKDSDELYGFKSIAAQCRKSLDDVFERCLLNVGKKF